MTLDDTEDATLLPQDEDAARIGRVVTAIAFVGERVLNLAAGGKRPVIRHVRPKFSCRSCESITQASVPSLPIERGRPGAALLAHVLISKYADHLPLYRQAAARFAGTARRGVSQ